MSSITIHDWINQLEDDDSLSLEQFYATLKSARFVIDERLEVAESDGVDLDNLDVDPDGL